MRGWPVLGSESRTNSGVFYFLSVGSGWLDSRRIHDCSEYNAKRQGRPGINSETKGFLLVSSSSPTLSPIHDGLDVSVTSNTTWFHPNHDMVSHRIYKLFFYREHSIITLGNPD